MRFEVSSLTNCMMCDGVSILRVGDSHAVSSCDRLRNAILPPGTFEFALDALSTSSPVASTRTSDRPIVNHRRLPSHRHTDPGDIDESFDELGFHSTR